jgi:hypothetical protein
MMSFAKAVSFMMIAAALTGCTSVTAGKPRPGYYVDSEDPDGAFGTLGFCERANKVSLGLGVYAYSSTVRDGQTVLLLGNPPLSVYLSADGSTLTPVADYDRTALERPITWARGC